MGWPILADAVRGLAILAIMQGEVQEQALKVKITQKLANSPRIDDDLRRSVGRSLREAMRRYEYGYSAIDRAMHGVNRERLDRLMTSVAEIFSPNQPRTSG
jgi:hypothetical protein